MIKEQAMAVQSGGQALVEMGDGRFDEHAFAASVFARRRAVPATVTKVVQFGTTGFDRIGLLEQVPAGEATLGITGLVRRRFETDFETDDVRTYRGSLAFPGRRGPKAAVDIEVVRLGGGFGSLTIRPAKHLVRGLELGRYLAAATAALNAVERALKGHSPKATTKLAKANVETLPAASLRSEDDAAA